MNIERRNFIELPSLQEIAEMDKQRQKAIETLEIIDDKYVKCQACGELKPMSAADSPLMIRPHDSRIYQLQAIIKQIERHHLGGTDARKEKEELKQLLEQEKKSKRELTRRLPLYSSKLTAYRWYCSNCYELEQQKQREKRKQIVTSLLTNEREG